MTDIITLGEAMIVFIAENTGDFSEIESFSKGIAGAELNVSIGLSRLGHKVNYITRMGDDVFGHYIKNKIEKEGIISKNISLSRNYTTGFYFKTKEVNDDPKVHYFRKNAAVITMNRDIIEEVDFDNAKILHITGITAALSAETLDALYAAIEKARANGMLISFDPNIRKQLWKSEECMIDTLNALASRCDLVLPGIKEGALLTGKETKEEIADFYLQRGAKAVIIKLGAEGAYLKTETEDKVVPGFVVKEIVDTVGAGDGFATGILSALLDGESYEQACVRGNAIGARMITSKEDNEFLPTREELAAFIATHDVVGQ